LFRLANEGFRTQIAAMSEMTIPVAEAAKDFLGVLAVVENRKEPTVLLREGKAVARIVPCNAPAASCEELASRWERMDKLPPEEAEAFAADLENSRKSLPLIKAAWD
jgi:antitoxin (DNA-binding transcriptional repressor) of toxin-antitoxin stability system